MNPGDMHEASAGQFLFDRYFKTLSFPGYFVEFSAQDVGGSGVCAYFEESLGWKGTRARSGAIALRDLVRERTIREIDLMVIGAEEGLSDALKGMRGATCHPRLLFVAREHAKGRDSSDILEELGYACDAEIPAGSVWIRMGWESKAPY